MFIFYGEEILITVAMRIRESGWVTIIHIKGRICFKNKKIIFNSVIGLYFTNKILSGWDVISKSTYLQKQVVLPAAGLKSDQHLAAGKFTVPGAVIRE